MNYTTLATADSINTTMEALKERGFLPELVANRTEALARIRELIPAGASVMNGSSRTLEEIGFVDYLKSGEHSWKNLHADILAEQDIAKQVELRKQSVLSDYYLGSAHAIAETGEIVVASNSGSQLPHLVFTSPNLILVVGAQKITPTLDTAIARVNDYVYPLEDARMKKAGMGGSFISKLLIINREPSFLGRKAHIIFVNEQLGF
jgi:L-lactate utilization protein LutB